MWSRCGPGVVTERRGRGWGGRVRPGGSQRLHLLIGSARRRFPEQKGCLGTSNRWFPTSEKAPFFGPEPRQFDSRFSAVAARRQDRHLHKQRETACDDPCHPDPKPLIWAIEALPAPVSVPRRGLQFASRRPVSSWRASTPGGHRWQGEPKREFNLRIALRRNPHFVEV